MAEAKRAPSIDEKNSFYQSFLPLTNPEIDWIFWKPA